MNRHSETQTAHVPKRVALGAGLFAAGALGYVYMNTHVPPFNPDSVRVDGITVGSCPSQHLGNLTVFYCQEPDGSLLKAIYPTAKLVNHGTFAAVENTIDAHSHSFALASGVAGGLGFALMFNGALDLYYKERTEDQQSDEDDYVPEGVGYDPTEYTMHAEHGRIPLTAYGDDVPSVPPDMS